ncbi:MAG: CDP-glycerol glycerophosphotransferase [Candidatus Eisenbacteria bacterium]|uniref:CDP-glycerol glycerophosphotransferase n=1 Tax=Eiseniibacteriota bacterium TaxID=2212470 RepID=A0A7Y2H2V0_UNCEI|nr:CDP-glycerol glycerophosphotransferase [Candidatus Eisenbacteria bacterium]
MKKIRILFKIGFLYHKAAFDPLIELYLEDERYDVYFALDEERIRKFGVLNLKFRPPLIDELEAQGYRFTDEKAGFDVIMAGDTLRNAKDYGDALLCFLNHGTGIKTILYRNLAKNLDTRYEVFVEGQYRVDRIEHSGMIGKSEVHLVGLPKLDYVFQGRFKDREALLKRWGLDPEKPTVIFAPTYKPTCLYDVKDAIFEATKERFNLIIKLHHYSWMGKYAPHKQHEIYEERVPQYPHSVLLPMDEYNIVPYMAAADVLMSEASSTVFDFLALGKIGVIYDLPCDDLKHSDGQPLLEEDNREFLKDCFVHVDAPEKLREAFDLALNPTSDMIKAAKRERDYRFHGLDGEASLRLKRKVEQLLSRSVIG